MGRAAAAAAGRCGRRGNGRRQHRRPLVEVPGPVILSRFGIKTECTALDSLSYSFQSFQKTPHAELPAARRPGTPLFACTVAPCCNVSRS